MPATERPHPPPLLPSLVLAIGLVVGLAALGTLLGRSALAYKATERTVTVKGLAERELPADVVVWPIQFTAADDDLAQLYERLQEDAERIRRHLVEQGIEPGEITLAPPQVTDRLAQPYGDPSRAAPRYPARQALTVYSRHVDRVRHTLDDLADLGKTGIAFSGGGYGSAIEYLFTRLNDVKPEMVEEATRNARRVALEFAEDSESRLGKIKRARQGTFSITGRDSQTPHIKKIRVVSTIEYYLSD